MSNVSRVPMLVAALLIACGGDSGPTGPSLPNVAGQYHGTFTITDTSVLGTETLASVPATATVTQNKEQVTISVVDQQGGSFITHGTLFAGGAIDLGAPDISALKAAVPQCDFSQAVPTNSASVVNNTLTLTGDVVGVNCITTGQIVPVAFQIRYNGSK